MFRGISNKVSSFWTTPQLPRFESCNELALLLPQLKKFERQVDALKAEADLKGPGSIAHQKHAILSDFLNRTKAEIDLFNNEYDEAPILPFMNADDADFENEVDATLKADLLDEANKAYYYQQLHSTHEEDNNLDVDIDADTPTVEEEKIVSDSLSREKEPLLSQEMEGITKLNADMKKLVENLQQIRKECLKANRETLNLPRNTHRAVSKAAVESLPPLATAVGAVVTAVTYGTGTVAVFGAHLAGQAVSHATGLNDPRAWCVQLSDDWKNALNQTAERLHPTPEVEYAARPRG